MGASCVRDSILRGPELLEASLRDSYSDCSSELGAMSDSESEISSTGRFVVPGFLKRTYGLDLTEISPLRVSETNLEEKLDGLRAVLPDVATRSKERPAIVLDAYHYISTLLRQVEDLNAELLDDAASNSVQTRPEGQWSVSYHSALCQEPVVDVAKRNGVLEIRIVCANRPGILVDIMEAIESRGLTIMHTRIVCHNEVVVEYLSLENEEGDSVLEGEEERMKTMLLHAICQA